MLKQGMLSLTVKLGQFFWDSQTAKLSFEQSESYTLSVGTVSLFHVAKWQPVNDNLSGTAN